ncbi:intracellular short-chain-length polyhydroxyalkanoate depolymerase [Halomarina oriensis]|uniref:Alpha/beta fold hydrolase n=1 Tax=Halomarina oriensis TaxID=671145 RepID=A0A6B0GQT1_9EURY|nr:alpha/beta hydrolase [Halomarina oriensis]MWG35727.1 alpha/beta fold hydrolase [Halomarina oriensis]
MPVAAVSDLPVRTVDLPTGETVGYRHREGDVPLVLLHGNMTSSKHWDLVLDAIDERFDVYAMDMRGFGASSYETPVDSLADFAADVGPFADAVGLDSFHLWGWSTGGGVAMQFAAEHPERVERLVLMDSVSTRGYPLFHTDETGQPTGEPMTTREEIAAAPALAPVYQAHETENRETFKAVWNQLIYTDERPEDDLYEDYVDDMLTQRNIVDVYHALAHFNVSDETNAYGEGSGLASEITHPTLVVHGDRDLVIPREMADETLADLPNAELVELEDCGHSPPIDALDDLLDAVEPFLLDEEDAEAAA